MQYVLPNEPYIFKIKLKLKYEQYKQVKCSFF